MTLRGSFSGRSTPRLISPRPIPQPHFLCPSPSSVALLRFAAPSQLQESTTRRGVFRADAPRPPPPLASLPPDGHARHVNETPTHPPHPGTRRTLPLLAGLSTRFWFGRAPVSLLLFLAGMATGAFPAPLSPGVNTGPPSTGMMTPLPSPPPQIPLPTPSSVCPTLRRGFLARFC